MENHALLDARVDWWRTCLRDEEALKAGLASPMPDHYAGKLPVNGVRRLRTVGCTWLLFEN